MRLRYRIEIVGLEKLTPDRFTRAGGIIFLPNHPAEIDPVLLEVALWKRFRLRPLITEHFYRLKGFKFFLDLARVLPIPSMDAAANKWRGKKVEKQFNAIVDKLRAGENFLIYPSGRLKISAMEILGGASFVHRLIERCPEVNIVLVRTTGLWGSMFSRALTGSSPNFGKTVWEGVKIILKNALFFTPKRKVKIELELPPADFPYNASRLEFNRYLENWYNQYPEKGPEPLSLVSYSRWSQKIPTPFNPQTASEPVEQRFVSSAVQNEIFKKLAMLAKQPIDAIERTMDLSQDLGLDSLDIAEVYVYLDERFEVNDLVPGELQTVEDVLQAAAGYKKELENQETTASEKQTSWPSEKRRQDPKIPSGNTLQEVFFLSCERNQGSIACADALSGPMSYDRVKSVVLTLALQFRHLPGDKVGLLLPSSVSGYLSVLALLCAGKVPVMLNWTTGVRALDHAVDLTELCCVISSDHFLDKLDIAELGKLEERLVLLEEIRGKIGWKEKLQGWILSKKKSKTLLKQLSLDRINPDNPAVILFTSGTESLPKGVPLSHSNLLSNQRACCLSVQIEKSDILYAVLPPFHSFGISLSGLLPLLAGFRAYFSPNPNDAHGMARDIKAHKPTLLFFAPSFIRALLRVANPQSLHSLRLIVSGAEKTPQELFEYVAEHLPKTRLIEGYGVTECSPVVTFDRLEKPHKGVGLPIPGVKLRIIDPETHDLLSTGQEGEVCVSGPSVFAGYLGGKPDPFIQIEQERYYRTGDRGWIDADGTLILTGRMKRFVKIGGEMVSLTGLEEDLLRIAHEKNWVRAGQEGPLLAVTVKEKETQKPILVLFATFPVDKENINQILKENGYGRLVKIGGVCQIEQIPLTGTGKTHYRLLDEMSIEYA